METKRADGFASTTLRCTDSVDCANAATPASQWAQPVFTLPHPSCPIDIPSPCKHGVKKSYPLMLEDSFFHRKITSFSKNTNYSDGYINFTKNEEALKTPLKNQSSFLKTDDELIFFFESDSVSPCAPSATVATVTPHPAFQCPGLSVRRPAMAEQADRGISVSPAAQAPHAPGTKTQNPRLSLTLGSASSKTARMPSPSLWVDTGSPQAQATSKPHWTMPRHRTYVPCAVPQSLPDSSSDSEDYEPYFIQSLDDSY